MDNSQQHNANFEPTDPPAVAHKQHGEEEIPISSRLRDREMLRKRKEKAQEKNSAYWIYREPRIKKPRKTRGDKKRPRNQKVVLLKPEAELKAGPEVKTQAGPEVKTQAGPSEEPAEQVVEELEDVQPKPKLQEKAEPVQQEQSPVLTTLGLGAGMPTGGTDGEPATSSQDAVGEEELLNLTEAAIPDDLNAPLDSLCQDNEHIPFLF